MVRSLPPRSRLLDAALVVTMALVGLAILIWAPTDDWYHEPSLFSALLVVASAGSLWWWRTAPVVSLIAACAVFMVNIVAGFPVGITQYPAFIAFYTVFASGAYAAAGARPDCWR